MRQYVQNAKDLNHRQAVIHSALVTHFVQNSGNFIAQNQEVMNDFQALFLAQELEQMESRTYEQVFQDLKMRQIFSMLEGVAPGASTSSYKTMQTRGTAAWANGSAKDIPKVGVGAKKDSSPLVPLWTSFEYDYFELLAAAKGDVALDGMLMVAARRTVEEFVDTTILYGDSDVNVPGWLDNTEIPTANVPNGAGGDPEWSTKTNDEILEDIDSLYIETDIDTNEKEKISKIALPTAQKHILWTRKVENTDSNLWSYIKKNSVWLKDDSQLVSIPQFKGVGSGGTDIMIGFDPSPEKVQYILPIDVTFMPVQINLLSYITTVIAKCGGLRIRYPLSQRRKEGI